MSAFVHHFTIGSEVILLPDAGNVDEPPLPAAKTEVLYARKHKIVVFSIHEDVL